MNDIDFTQEPKQLDRYQAAIISAYTGILTGVFGDMHAFVEHVMGRPVFTHEFANKKFKQQLKEKALPLFLSICNGES